MKPSELRIGNIFREKKTGNLIKVIELTKKTITFSGSFKGEWQAEPMPLTENWLKKFGFVKDAGIIRDELHWYQCIHGNAGPLPYRINQKDGFHYPGANHELKYVHQLQNLVFVITGQELKV